MIILLLGHNKGGKSMFYFDLLTDTRRANYDYITTKKDSTSIQIDMPGVKKEDLNIEVERGVLTVIAERKGTRPEKHKYRYKLPLNIEAEDITASLVDGVLTLCVASKPGEGAKKILLS